jgi:nitrite reductase/ring-hydroxylating ferredoxin subunit
MTQSSESYRAVLDSADLPEGQMRSCHLDGVEIVVCRTREGLFALDNICSHAYARLSEGRLRAHRIICPLHGAAFDLRDGRALGAPASKPVRTFAVRERDGRIEAAPDQAPSDT